MAGKQRHPRALACLIYCLLLGFSALRPVPARAEDTVDRSPASFDCAKAGGIDEKIICSDRLLRQADKELALAYRALLAETANAERAAALRADERQWIMLRNKECRVTKDTKVTPSNWVGLVDCFLAAYDERLEDVARLRANPEAEPSAISMPIRRPLFSEPAVADKGPPIPLLDSEIQTDRSETPLLTWLPNGGLAVLGRAGGTVSALYVWRPDRPALLLVPDIARPAQIKALCAFGDSLYLIRRGAGSGAALAGALSGIDQVKLENGAVSMVSADRLPEDLRNYCDLDPTRHVIGDDQGRSAIAMGLRMPDGSDQGREVTWHAGGAMAPTEPVLRIDRRLTLRGSYLPFAQDYLIAIESWPSDMASSLERRWAKSNCLPYWRIASANGRMVRKCVPFGKYSGAVAQILPSAGGDFFAIAGSGLFRASGEDPVRVIAGPILSAALSPDGCKIAFAGKSAQGGHPTIRIGTLCAASAQGLDRPKQ